MPNEFVSPITGPSTDFRGYIAHIVFEIMGRANEMTEPEPEKGHYGTVDPCWAVVIYKAAELAQCFLQAPQVVNNLGQCLLKLARRFKLAGESPLPLPALLPSTLGLWNLCGQALC
jgi:hypothetical protein